MKRGRRKREGQVLLLNGAVDEKEGRSEEKGVFCGEREGRLLEIRLFSSFLSFLYNYPSVRILSGSVWGGGGVRVSNKDEGAEIR